MNLSEERIKETAQLIKERDHALNMINRWQTKLDEANAALATVLVPAPETAPEPAPAPE